MTSAVKTSVGVWERQYGGAIDIVGRTSFDLAYPWVGITEAGSMVSYSDNGVAGGPFVDGWHLVHKLDGPPKEPEWLPLDSEGMKRLLGKTLKVQNGEWMGMVTGVSGSEVWIGGTWHTPEQVLHIFEHLDGTPVGRRACE